MEEKELVCGMIAGETESFDRLMELYQKEALRAAYLISGNYADSEDIVQETFVSCYLNRNQLKDPERFRGWFYRTLSRTAWKICKKKKREQPVEEIFPEEKPGPSQVLSKVIRDEEERELYGAIAKLPVKQRTVIVLYYFNQMSIKEIAKTLGTMEGTVKSRLFHGKARIKELLTEGQKGEGGTVWTTLS